ncbi:hypothetical protein E1200_08700 [Actinomadura sp. GC306]|uniref:hypothetical protein n=1 Tax=Actinomadura sp. GC306 TaxID=2530367 RepID=UPI00105228FA|nr:hypothetical protein [Actinomadura sp. GC306]TDC69391.1 hypothetical protein E1200_08700 [Actinomadura sp. GC306]
MVDAQRAAMADELEMRGSPLCDCAGRGPAFSRTTGAAIAHHCGCAAVRASALARRAASATRHARECGCDLADREAALYWEKEFAARRPGGHVPGSGAC